MDSAIASGGTMPAAITAAMISNAASVPWDSPAVAKRYAALFTGPPRSRHIMSPMITPSSTAEDPDMPVSPSCSAVMRAASGRPRNRSISPPTTKVVTSGMITTGISPASQRGGVRVVNHSAIRPASRPVMRPPRKPAPTATDTAPPMKPGAMPGRPARPKAM